MRECLQHAWHSISQRPPDCPSFMSFEESSACAVAGLQLHLLQLLGAPGQALADRLGCLAEMEQLEMQEVFSNQTSSRHDAAAASSAATTAHAQPSSTCMSASAAAAGGGGAVGAVGVGGGYFMGLLCGGGGGGSSSAAPGGGVSSSSSGSGAGGGQGSVGLTPICNLSSQQLVQVRVWSKSDGELAGALREHQEHIVGMWSASMTQVEESLQGKRTQRLPLLPLHILPHTHHVVPRTFCCCCCHNVFSVWPLWLTMRLSGMQSCSAC